MLRRTPPVNWRRWDTRTFEITLRASLTGWRRACRAKVNINTSRLGVATKTRGVKATNFHSSSRRLEIYCRNRYRTAKSTRSTHYDLDSHQRIVISFPSQDCHQVVRLHIRHGNLLSGFGYLCIGSQRHREFSFLVIYNCNLYVVNRCDLTAYRHGSALVRGLLLIRFVLLMSFLRAGCCSSLHQPHREKQPHTEQRCSDSFCKFFHGIVTLLCWH